MTITQLQLAAIHEAGHATVALAQGFGGAIAYVTIGPDGCGGMLYPRWHGLDFDRPEIARKEICVCLAGGIAERIHCRGLQRAAAASIPWDAADVDIVRANDHANTIAGTGRPLEWVRRDAVARTFQLLQAHWSLVRTIADALLDDGNMSLLAGHEIMTIFRRHEFGPLVALVAA